MNFLIPNYALVDSIGEAVIENTTKFTSCKNNNTEGTIDLYIGNRSNT